MVGGEVAVPVSTALHLTAPASNRPPVCLPNQTSTTTMLSLYPPQHPRLFPRSTSSRPLAAATTAIASCLIASTAMAQSEIPPAAPEIEARLPEVRVRARTDAETAKGPVIGYAAKRSGTATKTDTALNEVPQSITVISADSPRASNFRRQFSVIQLTFCAPGTRFRSTRDQAP